METIVRVCGMVFDTSRRYLHNSAVRDEQASLGWPFRFILALLETKLTVKYGLPRHDNSSLRLSAFRRDFLPLPLSLSPFTLLRIHEPCLPLIWLSRDEFWKCIINAREWGRHRRWAHQLQATLPRYYPVKLCGSVRKGQLLARS